MNNPDLRAVKTLANLFFIFLKIGATSFGGNVALVAAVRKELCEKRKILSDAQLLDYMTLGNLLPGPLATNVIATCGYTIAGIAGAFVSLIGVLLPAFVLLCLFAVFYASYGENPLVKSIFSGLLPGVAAVIAATAWSLAKRNVKTVFQYVILFLAAFVIVQPWLKGFYITLLVIGASGLLGLLTKKKEELVTELPVKESPRKWHGPIIAGSVLAAIVLVVAFLQPVTEFFRELRLLTVTFSGMSVTLFGGGYVFIPAMKGVVVDTHHWVTQQEFTNAIAVSQVTPGPISISATFIGWKVAGFTGAVVATLGIFLPPAMLMILMQQFISRVKHHPTVEAIFRGVRPAVIGMIAGSVWVIAGNALMEGQSIPGFVVIFVIVFALSLWEKVDTALLIPLAGLLGWLISLF